MIDPVEDEIAILSSHGIIVLEGNYVHLTVSPWDEAMRILDEKWFIMVEYQDAKKRVVKRHLDSGIVATEQDGIKRFEENDWPNGAYTIANSDVQNADRIIISKQSEEI
jgi:pantothenate kinase